MAAIIVPSLTKCGILQWEDSYVAVIHYTLLTKSRSVTQKRHNSLELVHSLLSFSAEVRKSLLYYILNSQVELFIGSWWVIRCLCT